MQVLGGFEFDLHKALDFAFRLRNEKLSGTLSGKLHIAAEMVSKVQREEFWMLFRIMSEEQRLCSPI